MLIATFGPATPWDGTRITWADGKPLLENHGPIGVQDVMEYDRQGYLVWADEGTRAWIGSLAAAGARRGAAAVRSGAAGDERAPLKRVLVWVIVALLVVNLVLLLVAGHAVHLF